MRLFRKKRHVSLYHEVVAANPDPPETQLKKTNFTSNYRLYFFLTLLLILLTWLVIIIRDNNTYPIKQVKILAEFKHLDPKVLQNLITPYTKIGFFGFNATALRKELLALPWINSASIQRVWPDKIIINITEQIPIAKWNDSALLNPDNEIFTPDKTTFPSDLPELLGPVKEIKSITSNYFAMNQMLKPLNCAIKKLLIDNRSAWYLVLDNGLEIFLGRKNIYPRFELFVKAYPHIISENGNKKAKSFDLRYDNGLAVKWENLSSAI